MRPRPRAPRPRGAEADGALRVCAGLPAAATSLGLAELWAALGVPLAELGWADGLLQDGTSWNFHTRRQTVALFTTGYMQIL